MNKLDHFKLPEESKEIPSKKGKDSVGKKVLEPYRKIISLFKKGIGENPVSKKGSGDEVVDAFDQIKRKRLAKDRLNSALVMLLIAVMVVVWTWGLPMLVEADQLKNDLKEQKQVIEIEKKNNDFLEKWAMDTQKLDEGIRKVYSAIPDSDEKAEEVISMLEDMASGNRMVIDAIGIRKLSESQMYYDKLIGVVDIYEYTFTLESTLPNILSFIGALRKSLRLMDIVSMEIEESKGMYRASFLLNSYHLTPQQ